MSSNPKIDLVVIPARGGSKGLPGKNRKMLGNVPLIAWTILAARQAQVFANAEIVVSTDEPDIAAIAAEFGIAVPVLRAAHLATDAATTADVILDCLEARNLTTGTVCLLQPTSPLRSPDDIDQAAKQYFDAGATMLASVTESDKPVEWALGSLKDGVPEPVLGWQGFHRRRQDQQTIFYPNGAIYISDIEKFRADQQFWGDNMQVYVMPRSRSIDIDTAQDFSIAEQIVTAGQGWMPS